MRVGVDLMGWQDPGARGRGIGRYTAQFVDALTHADPHNQYVLYCFDRFDAKPIARGTGGALRVVASSGRPLAEAVQALVDRNPDRIDLYLVTSPFSIAGGYRPPIKPAGPVRLASVLYDLIPMLVYQHQPDGISVAHADYFERIDRLRHYDLLLAISEATRRDVLAYLGMSGSRVVNISSATRESFFAPTPVVNLPESLRRLGIHRPYVLGVGAADTHKNIENLIRAFALLPPAIRNARQLVIVGSLRPIDAGRLAAVGKQCGVHDQMVLTGALPEEGLREAYQHCALFALVSHYEGFGLPILEAMQCGAPVVAGNNSAQIEVVAGAGLLAQTEDVADIAEKLARILSDPGLAASLRRKGLERARAFSWSKTVRRARDAFRALPRACGSRPLLAFFSPLPPERAAHADHALALLRGLCRHYTIHLYHEPGCVPYVALANSDIAAFDYRLFESHDRAWKYHGVLYLMDHPGDRGYVYQTLLRRPGVATLYQPAQTGDAATHGQQQTKSSGEVMHLDQMRRVLTQSSQVMVHDGALAEWLRATWPAYRNRVRTISPAPLTPRASRQGCLAFKTEHAQAAQTLLEGASSSLSRPKSDWHAVVEQYVEVIEMVAAGATLKESSLRPRAVGCVECVR